MNRIQRTLGIAGLAMLISTQGEAAFIRVCQRTAPVKAFLEEILKKDCAAISAADLLTVKRVAVDDGTIHAFQADDFSGLTNLEILNIRSNPYTELPEGLLTELVNLKTLVIISTTLRHYPDDFLQFNPNIENLHLFRNKVRSISESVLTRLEHATKLQVMDFDDELGDAEKTRLRRAFPENGSVSLSFF